MDIFKELTDRDGSWNVAGLEPEGRRRTIVLECQCIVTDAQRSMNPARSRLLAVGLTIAVVLCANGEWATGIGVAIGRYIGIGGYGEPTSWRD